MIMKMVGIIFSLLISSVCSADTCKTTKPINTDPYIAEIGTRKATFLVIDYKSKNCWAMNEAGLVQRHAPYSTFKIPHTLIALETGAVKSVDERFEWDQEKYPAKDFWPETWKKSHTLATAFKHSAVWYYKALVPRIKPAEYKKWLATFNYGNQMFTAGSNEFWLNNELQISPKEQVSFIDCLVTGGCGVSATHVADFETVALQEINNSLSLYAKTGAGPVDSNNFDGAFEGWYVGYVKSANGKAVAAFALYMEADSFKELKDYRKGLSLKLLSDLGLWGKIH